MATVDITRRARSAGRVLAAAAAIAAAAALTSAASAPPAHADVCTPGAPGCGWQDGQVVTYVQDDWGDHVTPAAALLSARFNALYGAAGYVEIGLAGVEGRSVLITNPGAVFTYLPASGSPAVLNADLVDPTSTASGIFGGEVLGLRFNIDLSDAGSLLGTTGIRIGDLVLCGVSPGLDGMTVRAFQSVANRALGGAPTSYGIADLSLLAQNVNGSFLGGTVTSFAREHLFNGACPRWQDGDLITYIQGDWGTPTTPAGALLDTHYNAVYASTFGVVEVGLPGASGRSMSFTGANGAFAYLPSSGLPAPLDADLVDPVSSASGVFGGEVLALRFNVDFSDAGRTSGTSGLRFGDLTLCDLAAGPSGISVRAFLAVANYALGGGLTSYAVDDLTSLAQDLNASFSEGAPSAFAQDHLVDGVCPTTPAPRLEIVKEVVGGVQQVDAGQPVSFVLTVRNTGTATAENVVLRDDLAGLVAPLGSLVPGQADTRSVTVVTTAADCPSLTNVARATADDVAPAEASAQVGVVCPDTTPPTCTIEARGKDAGGHAFIRFRVDETGRGLERHEVVRAHNATVAVDAYEVGSPGPVQVLATAVNPARSLGVTVDFYDRAGNRATCDPIVYAVVRVDDQPQDETFTGVPAAESKVTIENGDPGMRKVRLTVNGIRFKETDLRPGEVRRFDVAAAMRPGDDNTVVVRARGRKGASALIVLADID